MSAPAAGRGDPVAHTLADPGSLELGHEPKHGEERLPDWAHEIEALAQGHELDLALLQLARDGEEVRDVAPEPVEGSHRHRLDLPRAHRSQHRIERRAPGLGARDALVHVLDRALPMRGWIRGANSARILHFDRIRSAQIKDG